MASRIRAFFQELRRRKVFHVGTVYLITAWGASLGASELFPAFGIPDWAVRLFVIAAMLGFPLALVLAWAFEITPEGVQLDDGNLHKPTGPIASSTTEWDTTTALTARWSDDSGDHNRVFHGGFTIGRDPTCDLVVNAGKVSRQHTRVFLRNREWWIEDMRSRNGTRVNNEFLTQAARLTAHNEVVLFEGGTPIRLDALANSPTEIG